MRRIIATVLLAAAATATVGMSTAGTALADEANGGGISCCKN